MAIRVNRREAQEIHFLETMPMVRNELTQEIRRPSGASGVPIVSRPSAYFRAVPEAVIPQLEHRGGLPHERLAADPGISSMS
jgi:hypothetical protein